MPLRLHLAIWNAVILIAAISLVSIVTYGLEQNSLADAIDDSLRAQARIISAVYEARGSLLVQRRARSIPQSSVFAAPAFHVQVIDPDGAIIDASAGLGNRRLPVSAESLRLAGDDEEAFETVTVDGQDVRVFLAPIVTDDDFLGYIQVARSLEAAQDALAFLRRSLIGAGAALVAFSVLVVWLLAGVSLQPIVRMTRAAQAIGSSMQLHQRLPLPRTHDEVGRLVETFNRMMDRLEAAFIAQRRFVADASHELRTPLTTILGNLALLKRRGGIADTDMREALEDAMAEAERMSRLVHGLLALARADAGVQLDRHPVVLDELLRTVQREAQALADGVSVLLDGVEPVEITADGDSLKQLLLILVDNGLKFTDPGGTVWLGLRLVRDEVVLMVRDTGCGIAEEDLPHIFERFYRSPAARAGGGTGLGLAIARWIAGEHGGRIEVDSRVAEGTTISVHLPIERPELAPSKGPVETGRFIAAS